jgi:hypothetical protein
MPKMNAALHRQTMPQVETIFCLEGFISENFGKDRLFKQYVRIFRRTLLTYRQNVEDII